MKFEIITRSEAHAQHRKRFYTGRPCIHGHDAQRFVTTGGCVACNAARSKLFKLEENATQGRFVYPLHPEDYAAALAYCQGLDMARGRVPHIPRGAEAAAQPSDLERTRQRALDKYGPKLGEAVMPKP